MRIMCMSACFTNRLLTMIAIGFLCCLGTALANSETVPVKETGLVKKAAQDIDRLVLEGLDEAEEVRLPLSSDNIFARRIYLDIAGRIPSYKELSQFLDDKRADKRNELITSLLDSDGYVSHFYNYWEDILRIQSKGRRTIMVSYQDWLKDQLKENRAYDEFVYSLITAEGFVWDDPAVGYYLRDAGMQLDNMANTAQVFLGTRMQCAQCHNHPFDKWTQLEYYRMAAYTADVHSAERRYRNLPEFQNLKKTLAQEHRKQRKALRKKGQKSDKIRPFNVFSNPAHRRALREIFEPLASGVRIEKTDLKLPHDYQYNDAAPLQIIEPQTPFGSNIIANDKEDIREAYADWLTSKENPRFTRVIANRLWKKVMGHGLIEPIDNITENTIASNEQLMQLLEKTMVDVDYDIKKYLQILLNTRTYQSEAYIQAIAPGEKYYYQGPLLKRMSAEQIWDSILALSFHDIDDLSKESKRISSLRERERSMQRHVEYVKTLDAQEIIQILTSIARDEEDFVNLEKELQLAISEATTQQEKARLRREYKKQRDEKQVKLRTALKKAAMSKMEEPSLLMPLAKKGVDEESSNKNINNINERRNKWRTNKNFVRASEIISPVPRGHFLQQFGESERELISNSHKEAAIPQALSLLNGNTIGLLMNKSSPLRQAILSTKNIDKQYDILYLSFFSRHPTVEEINLMKGTFSDYKRFSAIRAASMALLNSNEFRFVQ